MSKANFLKAILLGLAFPFVSEEQEWRSVLAGRQHVAMSARASSFDHALARARIEHTISTGPGLEQATDFSNTNVANVLSYGATGKDAGKDGPAIQRAIEAVAGRGGGTVFFPAGYEFFCDAPLILDKRHAIHFVGGGGGRMRQRATINFTGAGDANSYLISLKQTRGIEFHNLYIAVVNPNFQGTLLATGKLPPLDDGQAGDDALMIEGCQLSAPFTTKALVSLEWAINVTLRGNRFYGARYAILGREKANNAGFSNAVLIDDNIFLDQTGATIRNAGENWKITNNSAEPIVGKRAGFYSQSLDYYAYQLTFIGNWLGDVEASGGAYIATRAVGLEIAGNNFYFDTGVMADAINLTQCDGVSITGNQFFGGAATAINFNNITSNGVHLAGNNLSVGTPIANLGEINGHAFLGNNVGGTPLLNAISNDLTVKYNFAAGGNITATGENTALGLNYLGAGIGFVKKAGGPPFLGFGRNFAFTIARSDASDVAASHNFTPLFTLSESGANLTGNFNVNKVGTGDIEVSRFSGVGGRSYISLGTGQTRSTGGYVLYDPAELQMRLGVHGSARALAVDGNGNVSVPGNLSADALAIGAGGATISKVLRKMMVLDFPAVSGFAAVDLTVSVPGATPGDVVSLGLPGAAMLPAAPIAFTAWVSANDIVTIRLTNAQANRSDLPGASYSVMVTKF